MSLENLDLFPSWVAEAAHLSADELAVLDIDHEALDAPGDASGPARFISVVFPAGRRRQPDVDHPREARQASGSRSSGAVDFGRETEEAAEVYGHVYDEVPIGEVTPSASAVTA